MARFAIPEILRTPLESLFLQVKSMDQDADVKQYLMSAHAAVSLRKIIRSRHIHHHLQESHRSPKDRGYGCGLADAYRLGSSRGRGNDFEVDSIRTTRKSNRCF